MVKIEEKTNFWVKDSLEKLGIEYTVESDMSDYMKESLIGVSKTKDKSGFGKPDFEIESFVDKFDIPVIIENKADINKLISKNSIGIKLDEKSVKNYAINGSLYYAQGMIKSGKYNQVVIVGVAGTEKDNIEIKVYYVFDSSSEPKLMSNTNFNFLENELTFKDFIKKAKLTDNEKHRILIKTKEDLNKQAKNLNKLMNNLSINAANRVIYVSGALLSMQPIVDKKTNQMVGKGLSPIDLTGDILKGNQDGEKIVNQIKNYLNYRDIPVDKLKLMMNSFRLIEDDPDHNEKRELDKNVSKLLKSESSINKQIFTFIYENIFKSIDSTKGVLDIMGEMYSEFLKYALGDGKGIGIVLTPPYITKMMAQILDVNMDSRVMDLATGSAGFLIAAMTLMIEDADEKFSRNSKQAIQKIESIKHKQLLGVENDQKMFTLASTNMILRGDGSTHIVKGNSFNPKTPNFYKDFKPDKLLLNPPFSEKENGMPFIEYGMKQMEKGGKAAIIIQDSAGSGKAVQTNKKILKNNTLLYSIKMPLDLFEPSAGVQTSIYVFETGIPHDFDKTVRFIDFRNDGYKRTSRGIVEVNNPIYKYNDIIKIIKAGTHAKIDNHLNLWNLDEQVVDDQINNSGSDWNFEQHQVINTKANEKDFKKTVSDYLSWEVSQIMKEGNKNA